jgi:hypothetical protein
MWIHVIHVFSAFYALCITGLVNVAQAQNQTQPPTDPNEGAPLSLSLSIYMCVKYAKKNHLENKHLYITFEQGRRI